MRVHAEIINNIYTLYEVQKAKLLERRKFMNDNPQ
jgi:hypothetical protein